MIRRLRNQVSSCRMPLWLRRHLGWGLLTALNKEAPHVEGISDARPVKAEDSDTSSWSKALGRGLATAVKESVAPQQFGVGISGGVELYVQGVKIKF